MIPHAGKPDRDTTRTRVARGVDAIDAGVLRHGRALSSDGRARPARGRTRVLRRMEQAARTAGCTGSVIGALFDRVAQLRERNGYETLARIPDFVGRCPRHILVKAWATAGEGANPSPQRADELVS
jgi:hypothetical protein